jgi:hypothetical protein
MDGQHIVMDLSQGKIIKVSSHNDSLDKILANFSYQHYTTFKINYAIRKNQKLSDSFGK